MSTLKAILAQIPANSPAIEVPNGPSLSYGQLRSASDQLSNEIAKLGLPIGSAVSISLENTLEFVVTFLGTINGFVAAPLNPNYKQSEFEFYINDVEAPLVIAPRGSASSKSAIAAAAKSCGAGLAEVAWTGSAIELQLVFDGPKLQKARSKGKQQLAPPRPTDTAFVLHTSGTTGRPKAVPLLHKNIAATVRNIIATYRLTANDASYLVMPLFHVHGLLAGLLAPLGAGGKVIVTRKFSARIFWKEFVDYGATWYTAVPTIHQIILRTPLPSPVPSKLRFVRSCSSSLAPGTFHELEAKLGVPVAEAYAMTEACHQMTSNDLPPGKRRPGTVGKGQGVDVVILDNDGNVLPQGKEGEISIRGENVTPGYLNNPKANAEAFTNGYFRTGDQGRFDPDGLLVITGRIKELINRGGEKISPIELDGVMMGHPAVAEAVSFGAPDKLYGQQVNAVVVLAKDQKLTEKELQTWLSERIAKFKIPVRIVFTDVMPKTATGKIQRRKIAEQFAAPKPKL